MDQIGDQRVQFEFRGSGSEYFRIWIVNVLLSIVTLGIYSAWAKVRRNRYLYACTRLDGSSFAYHGRPLAILKGRIAAFVLFGAYNIAFQVSLKAGLAMLLVLAAVLPWLVWRSLQFRLYNSSYRGIRFGFDGSAPAAYGHFLLLPLIAMGTGGIFLGPFVHQRLKRFQHTHGRYGRQHFGFDARAASFYKIYLLCALPVLAGAGLLAYLMVLTLQADTFINKRWMAPLLSLTLYAWLFIMYPLFLTMLQNLIWNHTSLGPNRFHSALAWRRMLAITLSNIALSLITLGLYIPFAQLRHLKYRLESTAMIVAGGLDQFVAGTREQVDAAGEGALDLFDFDLSM